MTPCLIFIDTFRIDLSDAARQPMTDLAGCHVVVYNGEIYNYIEIRSQLTAHGYRFRTASDTEVLLAAYDAWGTDCLERFNGMFAFAIWDRERKVLFCARDRLGVKPFYYCVDRRRFAFASEIKALLDLPGIKARARDFVVRDFLVHGAVEHRPETFFDGILKLPAGHRMVVDHNGVKSERYWDLSISSQLTWEETKAGEATGCFKNLLSDAVNLRLRSEVPVGTCLSGGIDSSAIVCLINRMLASTHGTRIDNHQKTFSAVSPVPELDERPYIRDVLIQTGVTSHWVEPTACGFLEELENLLWHQEEPFVSPSIYAQWCVFRIAREAGVTVVLDGQGADEQLCGYRKYTLFWFKELLRRKAYSLLLCESCHAPANWAYFLGGDLKHGLKYFYRHAGARIERLMAPGLPEEDRSKEIENDESFLSDRIRDGMLVSSLPSLLRYQDKNAMAFGVEGRTPFLDIRLVEYLANLPLEACCLPH